MGGISPSQARYQLRYTRINKAIYNPAKIGYQICLELSRLFWLKESLKRIATKESLKESIAVVCRMAVHILRVVRLAQILEPVHFR